MDTLGTFVDKQKVTHHITEVWRSDTPGFFWIRTIESSKPLKVYTTDIELCQQLDPKKLEPPTPSKT